MPLCASVLFAVVEIGGDPVWLLVAGVFLVTFLSVLLLAAWLFRHGKQGPGGATTWHINVTRQLPVSKAGFDRLAELTAAAVSRPEPTPARQAFVRGLDELRGQLLGTYRVLMIVIGLAGLALAIVWFQHATPANMELLPAAIVFILSAGALLNGLIPSRSLQGVEPIDPRLFDKIRVNVSKEPLTVHMDSLAMLKAAELLRNGGSAADAARAVYPGYDGLGESEQAAVRHAIAEAVRRSQQ